jgi:hypothetical protein
VQRLSTRIEIMGDVIRFNKRLSEEINRLTSVRYRRDPLAVRLTHDTLTVRGRSRIRTDPPWDSGTMSVRSPAGAREYSNFAELEQVLDR